MTNIIELVCNALNSKHSNVARIWEKGEKRRIYLKNDKDITAYLDFDEDLTGAALRIYSNCNQSQKWIANRIEQKKEELRWVFEIYLSEMAKINNNFSSYSEASQQYALEAIKNVN
jgi:hypothetical protein